MFLESLSLSLSLLEMAQMFVATSYGHCLIISNGYMVILEDLGFTMLITKLLSGFPNPLQSGTRSSLPTIPPSMKKQSDGVHPNE